MKKLMLHTELLQQALGAKPRLNQQGFIPMMLCIIGAIVLIIFLVYNRVAHVQH